MLVSWNVRDRFRAWSKAMNARRGRSRKHAVTLIEAVLFISIALGLIVGGLVFYGQASVARQAQEVLRLIQAINTEARSLVRQMSPGDCADTRTLIAMGAIPSGYVNSQDEMVLPWDNGEFLDNGGSFSVSSYAGCAFAETAQMSYAIAYQFTAMPKALCVRLLPFSADGVGSLGAGYEYLYVGVIGPGSTPRTGSFASDKWNGIRSSRGADIEPVADIEEIREMCARSIHRDVAFVQLVMSLDS